jgi:molybdate transport system substrate-binding protein
MKRNSAPHLARRAALLIFLSVCALASSLNCSSGEERRDEIVIAAAANLSGAFAEVGRRFEMRTGVRVVNSFGATADLARQIENGAPFDLFAAADLQHVEELERKGFIAAGTRRVYARGRLVLWVSPKGGSAGLARLEDLAGASVKRVAMAKPDVAPYGRAAIEALNALRLWPMIEPKVVYSQSVAQAKQFAETGNADAAFLPRSLVPEGEGRSIDVDERLHQPIDQALGVVSKSDRQENARRFVEFVLGAEGRAILEGYGYTVSRPE